MYLVVVFVKKFDWTATFCQMFDVLPFILLDNLNYGQLGQICKIFRLTNRVSLREEERNSRER